MARDAYNRKRREKRRRGRRCELCPKSIEHLHGLRKRCDDCQRKVANARQRNKRLNNPGQFQAYERSRQAHRTKVARKRYQTDTEYRERVLLKVMRRAERLGVGTRKLAILGAILDRDGLVCALCGEFLIEPYDGRQAHVDHIQPVSVGGPSDLDNLQLVHATCNLRKGARP